MAELAARPLTETLGDVLAKPPEPGIRLFWLGQAGFVVEIAGRRLVIDPYLSNSLAEKYCDGPFSHERLMPPPVNANGFGGVDLVLSTHHHADHMDPGTLRPLVAAHPRVRFVAYSASIITSLGRLVSSRLTRRSHPD